MKKGIAFFDFDGTITTKDSFIEFMRFNLGDRKFFTGFMLNAPYMLAFKLKLMSNQAAKEKMIRYFYKDVPIEKFNEDCRRFAKEILPGLIRPKALLEIERLKKANCLVVVVTASPENWVCYWTNELGIELIGSQLEVIDGKITGKLCGKNCHGEEKVRRITEKHVIADYEEIYAYGDTRGDLPMLGIATSSHYKPFRN